MLEDVKIRNYKESDNALCQKMWIELTEYHQEIYEDSSIGGNNPGQAFDEHLEKYGEENIWVAVLDNEIVGLVGLIIKGKEAEVEPIIISTAYRKRGIGKKLLRFIINNSSEKGIKYLSIRPVARNKHAMKIFNEMGFNIIGHIELFMSLKEKECKRWKTGIEIHDIPFDY
ncbi:MAG: GNAT family N-acetyltransferase [Candidatus Heimdallarchaeota archaeon]|nr:GNAT family N-acetyltransferase [Candidatus Heimdallarchaeota archaeon]